MSKPVKFGSHDSSDIDEVYIFDSMPSHQKCKIFCDGNIENRNIVTLEQGIVKKTYKGLPDEMNNAMFYTFDLHAQTVKNPIIRPIKRIAPLKVVRANRIILSLLSRTQYRDKIKPALSSNNFSKRKQAMSEIDFSQLDLSQDYFKSIAFQLGQTIALVQGQEVYTKSDISDLFEELRPFLYRENAHPKVLNEHRDRLLDLLYGVYTRKKGDLNLFCYENAPAIQDWNQFVLQSRGMIIDIRNERCVYYPFDKFFRINETPETNEITLLKDVPVEIVEKIDGSMVSCFTHNRKIYFACKGNFDVEQSRKAKELSKKYGTKGLDFDRYSYIFELVYPENRFPSGLAIVDYGNKEELVLVGLRDRLTNELFPYSQVIEEAKKHGFAFPKIEQKSLDEIIRESKKGGKLTREGWVARFENGTYAKIKFKAYLEVLKAANDMKYTTFVKKQKRNVDAGYDLEDLPEPFKQVASSKLEEIGKIADQIKTYFKKITDKHGHEFPYYALENIHPYKFQKPLLRFWRGQPYEHLLDRLTLNIYLGKLEMPKCPWKK